jgi:toxin ParE1/3/4
VGALAVSADAQRDIDAIADYIAARNISAALKWVQDIREAMQTIADMPGIGTIRDELRPGLRSYAMGDYLVFFRASGNGAEIVMVVHGSRDLSQIFPSKP